VYKELIVSDKEMKIIRRRGLRYAINSRRRNLVNFFLRNVFQAKKYSFAILGGPNKGNNLEFRDFVNSFGFRVCRFTQRNARTLPSNIRPLFYSYTFIFYGRDREKFNEFFKDKEWLDNFSEDFTIVYLGYNQNTYYTIEDLAKVVEQQNNELERENRINAMKVDQLFYPKVIMACRAAFTMQFLHLFYHKYPLAIPASFHKYGIST